MTEMAMLIIDMVWLSCSSSFFMSCTLPWKSGLSSYRRSAHAWTSRLRPSVSVAGSTRRRTESKALRVPLVFVETRDSAG